MTLTMTGRRTGKTEAMLNSMVASAIVRYPEVLDLHVTCYRDEPDYPPLLEHMGYVICKEGDHWLGVARGNLPFRIKFTVSKTK